MNRKVMSIVAGLALLVGMNVAARVRVELTQEQKDHAIELVSAIIANRVADIDRHLTIFTEGKFENPGQALLLLAVFDQFVKELLGADKLHLLGNNAGRHYTNMIGMIRKPFRMAREVEETFKLQRPVEPEVAR